MSSPSAKWSMWRLDNHARDFDDSKFQRKWTEVQTPVHCDAEPRLFLPSSYVLTQKPCRRCHRSSDHLRNSTAVQQPPEEMARQNLERLPGFEKREPIRDLVFSIVRFTRRRTSHRNVMDIYIYHRKRGYTLTTNLHCNAQPYSGLSSYN